MTIWQNLGILHLFLEGLFCKGRQEEGDSAEIGEAQKYRNVVVGGSDCRKIWNWDKTEEVQCSFCTHQMYLKGIKSVNCTDLKSDHDGALTLSLAQTTRLEKRAAYSTCPHD